MLYEAGFVTLIRTILILFAIYYGFKLVVKFLLPIILKRFINKQTEKFNGNSNSYSNQKEGEVHIKSSQKQSSSGENLGEYVDYEELDETK